MGTIYPSPFKPVSMDPDAAITAVPFKSFLQI